MSIHHFPIAYRWFLAKGLSCWQPWYFTDTSLSVQGAPKFSENEFALRAFKQETGADFDVYLFARRQDMDDYAFFVVKDGMIQDKVVSIHLSFVKRFELIAPLRYLDVHQTFTQWVREVAISDVEDWMTEEDMVDGDTR